VAQVPSAVDLSDTLRAVQEAQQYMVAVRHRAPLSTCSIVLTRRHFGLVRGDGTDTAMASKAACIPGAACILGAAVVAAAAVAGSAAILDVVSLVLLARGEAASGMRSLLNSLLGVPLSSASSWTAKLVTAIALSPSAFTSQALFSSSTSSSSSTCLFLFSSVVLFVLFVVLFVFVLLFVSFVFGVVFCFVAPLSSNVPLSDPLAVTWFLLSPSAS